jgi:hypothetical protein
MGTLSLLPSKINYTLRLKFEHECWQKLIYLQIFDSRALMYYEQSNKDTIHDIWNNFQPPPASLFRLRRVMKRLVTIMPFFTSSGIFLKGGLSTH